MKLVGHQRSDFGKRFAKLQLHAADALAESSPARFRRFALRKVAATRLDALSHPATFLFLHADAIPGPHCGLSVSLATALMAS
jgi:hypothetical protein